MIAMAKARSTGMEEDESIIFEIDKNGSTDCNSGGNEKLEVENR